VQHCHQSIVQLAGHNIQLVWVPEHMGINGNEIADQLAREDSSYRLVGPESALGIDQKQTYNNWRA
jgi:Ribonuclease HI